jgi:hypothetical protein
MKLYRMAIIASIQCLMRRRLYLGSQPRTTKRDEKILGLILVSRVKKSIDFSSYFSKPELVILVGENFDYPSHGKLIEG